MSIHVDMTSTFIVMSFGSIAPLPYSSVFFSVVFYSPAFYSKTSLNCFSNLAKVPNWKSLNRNTKLFTFKYTCFDQFSNTKITQSSS